MMKKQLIMYLCLVLSVFSFSCTNDNTRTISKSMNDYSDSIKQIERRVKSGDTTAYKDLRVVYLEQPISGLLPWSKLMADKYSYAPAFYDVYYVLLTSNNYNLYAIDSLNPETRKAALKYLIIAAQMNQENAIEILDSLKIKR